MCEGMHFFMRDNHKCFLWDHRLFTHLLTLFKVFKWQILHCSCGVYYSVFFLANPCNGTHNYCLLIMKYSWPTKMAYQGEVSSLHCLQHVCVLHLCVCKRGLSMCRSFLASSFGQIMKDSVVLFLSLSYLLLKDCVSVWAAIQTDTWFLQKSIRCWLNSQGQLRAKNLRIALKNIHTFSPTGDFKYWEKNTILIYFIYFLKPLSLVAAWISCYSSDFSPGTSPNKIFLCHAYKHNSKSTASLSFLI